MTDLNAKRRELQEGAARLGVRLAVEQMDRLHIYLRLLQQWGAKMNLIGQLDADQIVSQHFLDSLALLPCLGSGPLSLVDVGSGAGFPGAVCALMRPDWSVTLVERIQKRAGFLFVLRRELGLNFQVLATDASAIRDRFDVAVSRAVFIPPAWVETGRRLVHPGGTLAAMIGGQPVSLPVVPGLVRTVDLSYRLDQMFHRILCWRVASPA